MVTIDKVRVIRFVRDLECTHQYGIYFGVKTFDNCHFILKTDRMNLAYLYVTLTGKVQRWKHYLQDRDFHHVPEKEVHQFVPDALSRLCDNHMPA